MTADEYVPSDEEMYQAYRRNRPLDHHQDVEGAFARFLARVRRDALAQEPTDAEVEAVADVLAESEDTGSVETARAALSAARAARRDEEKRGPC